MQTKKHMDENNGSGFAVGGMDDPAVTAAIVFINELLGGNCGGHDAAHSMRVYRNAMMIARDEPGCDLRIAALAALLHDADDHKLFATVDCANARSFLSDADIDPAQADCICEAIEQVSFSKNRGRVPSTLEAMIVQDADRLDAIGAVGIARTFAYGGEHGRSLERSIDHFYEKLLLLKDEMNTSSAKRIAVERHAFLELFLKEFELETRKTDA